MNSRYTPPTDVYTITKQGWDAWMEDIQKKKRKYMILSVVMGFAFGFWVGFLTGGM